MAKCQRVKQRLKQKQLNLRKNDHTMLILFYPMNCTNYYITAYKNILEYTLHLEKKTSFFIKLPIIDEKV